MHVSVDQSIHASIGEKGKRKVREEDKTACNNNTVRKVANQKSIKGKMTRLGHARLKSFLFTCCWRERRVARTRALLPFPFDDQELPAVVPKECPPPRSIETGSGAGPRQHDGGHAHNRANRITRFDRVVVLFQQPITSVCVLGFWTFASLLARRQTRGME
jgi:hypothetical protein